MKNNGIVYALNTYPEPEDHGTPIDGVGVQAHWWSDNLTQVKLENTIVAFKDMGSKIHITELDVSGFGQNDNTMPVDLTFNATREAQHITNYCNQFNRFRKHRSVIKSVKLWNVSNYHTWRANYPVTNRTDYPLLRNTSYQRKQVYTSVLNDMP